MAALELIQAGEHTWYIPGYTQTGVYEQDGKVCLIDSGNDKDAGRKLRQLLEKHGWELEMICSTHSNADHIGGNYYLQKSTGCRIGAAAGEKPFIEYPVLEPAFLWGGYPHRGLEHKFLMAEPSVVTDLLVPGEPIEPFGIEVVSLPGHFMDMIGFRTPDGVFFAADSYFPERIISKYHIFYIYDVSAYLQTLETLASLNVRLFVPSHGDAGQDVTRVLELNRQKIHEIAETILEVCRAPKTPDEVIEQVAHRYGLQMNAAQYVLIGSTLRSYLGFLEKTGGVTTEADGYIMKWKTRTDVP